MAWAELNEIHYQVMRLLLAGDTLDQIHEKTGVWPPVVNRWKNEFPAFKAEYARFKEALFQSTKDSIISRLQDQAPKSLDKLVHLRDHGVSERTQLDAAKDLLDRAGYVPVTKSMSGVALALPPELTKLIESLVREEEVGNKQLTERRDKAVSKKEVSQQSLLLS